jgi:hypothetical protein
LPANDTYNLCPICQRNTYASTSEAKPDVVIAAQTLAHHDHIREWDAKLDAEAEAARVAWNEEMEELLFCTDSTIPDPSQYTNPQDVRFRQPPLHGATDA